MKYFNKFNSKIIPFKAGSKERIERIVKIKQMKVKI